MRPPLPPWLYPSPWLVAVAMLLAHLLDAIYPYHRGLALTLHPVHTSYVLAKRLAPPGSSFIRGAAAWLTVMASHLAVAALILRVAWSLGPLAWLLAAAVEVKLSIGLRLLLDTVSATAAALEAGRLAEARMHAQGLVRRNLAAAPPGLVASAAAESLAESLVDGYVSPLLYAGMLGPLGAVAQRVANTLDGALGYRTPDYLEAGRLSAWADTVLNYLPARLTALLITLAAPLAGGSARGALAAWRRFHGATESRNAGHPMSAMAGALGVALEKRGHYRLGEGGHPGAEELRKAVRIAAVAAALYLAAVEAALLAA